jgi:hypothetical protein
MTEKSANPRGRPITNRIEKIPAPPEDIAKAIFRAADKAIKPAKPKGKPKPN